MTATPPESMQDEVRSIAQRLLSELELISQSLASCDQDALYSRIKSVLDRCSADLAAIGLWGPQNQLPSSELWNLTSHLLARGWLQNQARTKPRGYAGDYEMLSRIYESRLCDDPLGRLFDRYFQSQAAPQAVRNRMQMMTNWIKVSVPTSHQAPLTKHSRLHIAILGSAFGLEIRDALLQLQPADRQRLHITLLDLDPAAIDFARSQLSPLLSADHLVATSANLFRLAERPQIAALVRAPDLLFCPGLFDYLDDAAAAAMLGVLYQRLAPGGRLTIFQFAPHNPTRAYMEWIGNWYLIYRDTAELRNLADAANIPSACIELGAEPLGVDLYLTATRPSES